MDYRGSFNGIESIPTEDYDIFLYTSLYDGLPNILLEVAEKGMPIVTSNVGGVSDLIEDGVTGYLVENVNDVDLYVAAINKLSISKQRTKIVENAHKVIKDKFNRDRWSKEIESIFDK
jgi:glycosyltransferase involved in cell wall biosynthesis